MEFYQFHMFNKLVRRGLVQALVCSRCDNPLSLELGRYDEPTLYCYVCSTEVTPGLDLYDNIRAVVKEHFAPAATGQSNYPGAV